MIANKLNKSKFGCIRCQYTHIYIYIHTYICPRHWLDVALGGCCHECRDEFGNLGKFSQEHGTLNLELGTLSDKKFWNAKLVRLCWPQHKIKIMPYKPS